jgi:hypothetical protein
VANVAPAYTAFGGRGAEPPRRPGRGDVPRDQAAGSTARVTDFPTARTMPPQDSWLCLLVWCSACYHQGAADLQAIIDAGQGDKPLKDVKFRCAKCGSRRTDGGIVAPPIRSGSAIVPVVVASDPIMRFVLNQGSSPTDPATFGPLHSQITKMSTRRLALPRNSSLAVAGLAVVGARYCRPAKKGRRSWRAP